VEIRKQIIDKGLEEQIEPQTQNELWEIIRTLKLTTSPGEKSISAELIKYGDKKLWEAIYALMGVIWA
jgi:hypothetical protein